ncbi:MAG: hypothetical protein A2Y38_26325 [Spirochaetes bacterium GWB1_59_5]|nr:MAG: hypothetical protein A2Y38_26325 [Spirochaetes bacterium GWB1_59_5]
MTQATRMIMDCATGMESTEVYDIPDPTPTELVTLALAEEQRIISMLQSAVQNHLDDGARLRMYDGILSACSYVNSTDPVFSAEGLAYCEWRDGCWRKCYEVLNACQNALRAVPTNEELINELPALVLS